jgi:hypothetical protein
MGERDSGAFEVMFAREEKKVKENSSKNLALFPRSCLKSGLLLEQAVGTAVCSGAVLFSGEAPFPAPQPMQKRQGVDP